MGHELERFFRRLEGYSPLSEEERLALASAVSAERNFAAREDLVHERRGVEGVYVILDGFACRYKLLPDGRRQIVGFLLPGEACDMRVFMLKRMDHSIGALGPVRAAVMSPTAVAALIDHHPRLARTFWWRTMVEDSTTREWVVNVGYRSAFQRVAHLLCEVFWRLEAVGLTQGNECRFPLTQTELGDSVALSSVHVNRTLMYMRRANLVRLHGGTLHLLDRRALESAAGFDPGYLQLDTGESAGSQWPEGGTPQAYAQRARG